MIKKHALSVLLWILVSISVIIISSCNGEYKKLVKAGDKAYSEDNYYGAAKKYKQAYQIDSTEMELSYKLAESNRQSYDYETAEKFYEYILENDEKEKFPKTMFWLAMTKKLQGSYAQAMNMFDEYSVLHKDKDGGEDYYILKSENEVFACSKVKDFLSLNADSVKVKNLGKGTINDVASDYAAFQYGSNILYFSSLRNDTLETNVVESEDGATPKVLSKIYKSYLRDSVWSEPKPLDFNIFNSTELHTGNTAFSPDLKRVYFTKCVPKTVEKSTCTIYMSEYKDGEWQEPEKLNNEINMPEYNNTHPFIASNGSKGEILFFSSDRPDGYGKMDIYYCEISKDGEYSEVKNLGNTINTLDNEITPYYDAAMQSLYFSSDWHEGLGGFDIFKSKGFDLEWTEPENIGFPFNTAAHDTYFKLNDFDLEKRTGYISSNRAGATANEGAICCNDIYSFKFVEPKEKKEETFEDIAETTEIEAEKAVRALIPVFLYFHNDMPDSNSTRATTQKNYVETYQVYKDLEDKYVTVYASNAENDSLKETLAEDIKKFFNDYVDKGFNTLDLFSELLIENLEAGRQVTITLKGFTSPLNTAEYNNNLAQRRIQSLYNYFNTYKEGLFKKYMNGTAESKGFLTFIEDPIGEAECPPNVSDDPNDIENSIYNPNAGKERRVEILSISLALNPSAMDAQIEKSREAIKKEIDEQKQDKEEAKESNQDVTGSVNENASENDKEQRLKELEELDKKKQKLMQGQE